MTSAADTSTPLKAREHARAMAGAAVEAMPTIPARAARGLPPGVRAEDVVWDETIGPGGYTSRVLKRGTRLRITELKGDACVQMLAYNADHPIERLNVADTTKVQWNGYLGAEPGKARLLLSDMGRVLLSILDDTTAGRHDCFSGASNERTNAAKYGEGANHSACPNARDRFLLALAKHGLGRKDVMPCVNFLKGVTIETDGTMTYAAALNPPESHITLRAEMNTLVVFANTPHVLDPRGSYGVTPVRFTAWRGPVTPEDDAVRNATPEGLRAYQNVEDYYSS